MNIDLRVAIFFHRFGPYHHARLKAAGARVKVTGIEFSNVDSMYAWDLVQGADGFDRLTLFSEEAVEDLPVGRIRERINQTLDQIRPQAVMIPGWSDRCSLLVLLWCASRGVPAVMMSETTAWDFERKWLKEILKQRLLKLCAAGLVGGRSHAEYLERLGVASPKIFFGYDAVDNDYFAVKAAEIRSQCLVVRKQLGLSGNFFLASARFVEKKNLSRLIQAYAEYRQRAEKSKTPVWDLVLLGDGPLRDVIVSQITALKLEGHVRLHGFKQYGELPAYYALANVFIHASTTEQWGLVVNEAMASGLPVLVSNRCGCAADLVQEGVNGFSFDPYSVGQMADLMLRCTMSPIDLADMGNASEKLIADWGTERFADGLQQAAQTAMKTPVPKASALNLLPVKLLLRLL